MLSRSHKALEPQGAGEPSSDGATDEEPLSPAVSTGSSYDSAADDTDRILNYVLQLVYGADLEDLPGLPLGACRSLVAQFVSELGSAVDEGYHKASPSSSTPVQEQHPGGAGGIPGASSGGGAGSGKRKASLDDFEWSAEDMAGGDNGADSAASSKKTRSAASERLQISCPFRKRNPTRFNVRSHHSCALTSFPKLSELRQHVAKKHRRRPSPLTGSDLASPWGARSSFPRMSQHVCIRCSEPFASRAALEAHLRLPPEEICRSSGAISTSTDPEDGLDNETMDRLLDRGRKTLGAPPEVQWRELWSIIFPDDDEGSVPSFSRSWPWILFFEAILTCILLAGFVPPVEHHELLSRLNDSLTRLSTQLLPLLHQFLISGSAQRNQLDGDHSHGIAAAADATEAVTKMVVSHICLLADQCVTEAARVTDAHHNRHTAAMAASATLLQATGSNPSSFSPLSGHHNQQQLPWTSMPGPTGTPTAGVSFLPSATLEGVEPPPLQQQPFMPIVFSQQTSSLPYHPARHMPVYHHALPQSSLSSFRGHHGRSQSATIGATAGWQQPPAGHAHVVPATVTGGELLAGSFSGNIDQLARWIAGTSNGYGPPDSDLNLELDDENHQDH